MQEFNRFLGVPNPLFFWIFLIDKITGDKLIPKQYNSNIRAWVYGDVKEEIKNFILENPQYILGLHTPDITVTNREAIEICKAILGYQMEVMLIDNKFHQIINIENERSHDTV